MLEILSNVTNDNSEAPVSRDCPFFSSIQPPKPDSCRPGQPSGLGRAKRQLIGVFVRSSLGYDFSLSVEHLFEYEVPNSIGHSLIRDGTVLGEQARTPLIKI